MDSISICGGNTLQGELSVQGSKNAALPILAASVLIKGCCVIENCPDITDVSCMIKLLESIGCIIQKEGNTVTVDASVITEYRLPSEYVTRMRSSVVLMGALLGRLGNALLDYPGGCIIGKRPIDLHMQGFCKLGVWVTESDDRICGEVTRLKGCQMTLDFPSVGATENIILASVLAEGCTQISNYALEPEIEALCDFLNKAGACIEGFGDRVLRIHGCQSLHPLRYRIPADRIVAGTYLLGCQAAGGSICLTDAPVASMEALLQLITKMGSKIQTTEDMIWMQTLQKGVAVPYIKTQVYPGFPTDLQSPLLVALSLAKGESILEEAIFEDRFRVVEELNRMGSNIVIGEKLALIKGVSKLDGRQVAATELRGGAALVLAGLCAQGITIVQNRHFIDRGYENIQKDLKCLGAKIS